MRRTRKIKRNVRNYFAQPNRNSIFILGNQKSGTSAIANLLSQATSKSLTPDFISAIDHPTLSLELSFDLLAFSDFVQKYKFEFSNQIIKEPILSFYIDKLIKEFPESIFILIVRNPYHNIRSILNRLSIPGDLENINYHNYDTLNRFPVWKLALQSEMLGLTSSNYIEAMANRWNYIINTYLANKQNIHFLGKRFLLAILFSSSLYLCMEVLHNNN